MAYELAYPLHRSACAGEPWLPCAGADRLGSARVTPPARALTRCVSAAFFRS